MPIDPVFWRGKKVLVTGHTGFKGSWLCKVLLAFNAEIIGYSLPPPPGPNLFEILRLEKRVDSRVGDIRDKERLIDVVKAGRPEFVVHMAAQPLVGTGYADPAYTYETNVIGTMNALEAVRRTDCVRSFLNIATDKIYKNNEWVWGYREVDAIDGLDPYSNSKSCAELVADCYRRSFFQDRDVAVSSACAGNAVGGGDFSENRIIPDCFRAVMEDKEIAIRNPDSVRPYQHVLEALGAYLAILQKQREDAGYAGRYNVGPDSHDHISTEALTRLFCKHWGEGAAYVTADRAKGGKEAGALSLDSAKLKAAVGWRPQWDIDTAVAKTVEWFKEYRSGASMNALTERQVNEYFTPRPDGGEKN